MTVNINLELKDVRADDDTAWFYTRDLEALAAQQIVTVGQLVDAFPDAIEIACRNGFQGLEKRINQLKGHIPKEYVLEDVRPGMFDGSIARAEDGQIVVTFPDPS